MSLKLVKPDDTEKFCSLMEELESELSEGFTLYRTKFKDCLAWYIENPDGYQIRIIFDQYNGHLGAIGKHSIVDDAQELLGSVEDADRDGFTDVFVHLTFKGL